MTTLDNALKRVTRGADKMSAAKTDRDAAIKDAKTLGGTLRAIGAAAGVSYEEVRRILAKP